MPSSDRGSLVNQLNLVFENITQKTVSGMEQGLIQSASMLKEISQGIAPRHIGQFLQISSIYSFRDPHRSSGPVPNNPKYHREISVYVKIKDAPDAAAWEYGSGLHDPNTPHLIPIAAKNVPLLQFWWENRRKWFKGARLPFGHPGIKMRSYLRQPMLDNQERIREKIVQGIQEANNVQ